MDENDKPEKSVEEFINMFKKPLTKYGMDAKPSTEDVVRNPHELHSLGTGLAEACLSLECQMKIAATESLMALILLSTSLILNYSILFYKESIASAADQLLRTVKSSKQSFDTISDHELDAYCETIVQKFRQMYNEQGLSVDKQQQIKSNMNFVKQMIIKEVRQNFLDRKYITPSVKDSRPIRWVLQLKQGDDPQDAQEAKKGRCQRILDKLKTHCKREEEVLDFNSLNLMEYFDNLESEMRKNIFKEKNAIRNWQTLFLRLTLYSHLRRAIKKPEEICKCSNRRLSKTEKVKEHRASCYLHTNNVKADLGGEMGQKTNHWESLFYSKENDLSWYEAGKYVLDPEGLFIQIWYTFSNICFFCAIFNICSHLAFDLHMLGSRQTLEIFFDIIFLIDIILLFFTAAEILEKDYLNEDEQQQKSQMKKTSKSVSGFQRYEYNMLKIAKHYLSTYFFWDILACLPTLLTLHKFKYLYYFKLFRFLQVPRILGHFRILKRIVLKRSYTYFIFMENVANILMQAVEFLLIFHVMSCLWIRLHIYEQKSWIYEKFDTDGTLYSTILDEVFTLDDLDWLRGSNPFVRTINQVYVDAYYFMSTTMSCIGYGDISPKEPLQKLFIILCQLVGLFCFGRIQYTATHFLFNKKMDRILVDTKLSIEDWLQSVDKSRGDEIHIPAYYYDKIIHIALRDFNKSPDYALQRNEFYQILTPKLKTQLVNELLESMKKRFRYFFTDVNLNNVADETLVRKILSSLRSVVYVPGSCIVSAGQTFDGVYFIEKNDVLVSDLFMRFHITKLVPRSFFGEEEILKGIPSQYFYSASDQGEHSSIGTTLYFLPKQKFNDYMADYPYFESAIRERATLRRAFWRKIELEFESKLAFQLQDAGLIDSESDEDAENLIDPLHLQDYSEWKKGNILSHAKDDEIDWDDVRRECVQNTVMHLLGSLKFNPIKPQYRQMLMRPRYTELTSFQQYSMELSDARMHDTINTMKQLVKMRLPSIHLTLQSSHQLIQKSILSQQVKRSFYQNRFENVIFQRFSTNNQDFCSRQNLNMVLHQTKLHLRAKHRFIKDMSKLIDVHDSDQEAQIRRHKFVYGKQTRLTIPETMFQKQKSHATSKVKQHPEFLDLKVTKLMHSASVSMSTSQMVTKNDNQLAAERVMALAEFKRQRSIAKAKKYLMMRRKSTTVADPVGEIFSINDRKPDDNMGKYSKNVLYEEDFKDKKENRLAVDFSDTLNLSGTYNEVQINVSKNEKPKPSEIEAVRQRITDVFSQNLQTNPSLAPQQTSDCDMLKKVVEQLEEEEVEQETAREEQKKVELDGKSNELSGTGSGEKAPKDIKQSQIIDRREVNVEDSIADPAEILYEGAPEENPKESVYASESSSWTKRLKIFSPERQEEVSPLVNKVRKNHKKQRKTRELKMYISNDMKKNF